MRRAFVHYTTFGELSVIINSNWVLFATIFKSQRAVERVMASLNLLRGPIAHCCPLSEDEIDRLRLAVSTPLSIQTGAGRWSKSTARP
jgi:hypothetical protein